MNSESVFRIIQAAIFIAFILHRGYYNRQYPPSEGERLEEQTKGKADVVANLLSIPALLSLALFVVYPRWMSWASFQVPDWGRWVGVAVSVTGFALLQWSHQSLGHNWSDQPIITKTQTLTTSGPYRWIRHPIYTSFLMILGSPVLITANWFIGTLWILIVVVDIRSRIAFEEAKLHERFGDDFETYRQSTGGLLPRLR